MPWYGDEWLLGSDWPRLAPSRLLPRRRYRWPHGWNRRRCRVIRWARQERQRQTELLQALQLKAVEMLQGQGGKPN